VTGWFSHTHSPDVAITVSDFWPNGDCPQEELASRRYKPNITALGQNGYNDGPGNLLVAKRIKENATHIIIQTAAQVGQKHIT